MVLIPVTKPFIPPQKEYIKYLKDIWDREYLTNNGPVVQELEHKLRVYLGVNNLIFLSNGTIALQIAIKALGLKGDIITTPFSYVATTSSIAWEGCNPVFVDIDPDTLNINPELIEQAITPNTSGILATHVFGNPCDIEVIQKIAERHHLKVIYDAAHCFGTRYKGHSVYKYGDISTASFHATKLFHTVEGGAIFANDPELVERASRMRNFGHAGFGNFDEIGINGKNSEFHAAMGLCNLQYAEEILAVRKKQYEIYNELLRKARVKRQSIAPFTDYNYSYYPIILDDESVTLRLKEMLEVSGIFPRRYFYPSLHTLNYVQSYETPQSDRISKSILCLPLYHDMTIIEQDLVATVVNKI